MLVAVLASFAVLRSRQLVRESVRAERSRAESVEGFVPGKG